jgi:DMSO/TMAO reductase YedYZ molybdopterin-dependent catalytic subunit
MKALWVAALAVGLLAGSSSAVAAAGVDTVAVTGAVHHPTTLTMDGLRALPAQTQTVTYGSDDGQQFHTYVGVTLADVVTAADPIVDGARKHPLLPVTVVATGADGYTAAFAWGELAPELARTPVLVAYTEDGQPLERATVVVPGDHEGARYVHDLTELRVVDLG